MLDEFTCVDCGVGRWLLFRFLNSFIGLFLRSIRIYKWPHELSRWPVANKTGCFDIEVICFIVELWKCPFLLLIMLLWFFISIEKIWHQDNLAPDNLASGQFGTKIVKTDNLAPRRQPYNLALTYIDIIWKQGGIKCANQRTGFIDSEDPKHTLFCRETAFVAIYALF